MTPLISAEPSDEGYVAFRQKALSTTAAELHIDAKANEAFGLVADIAMPQGIITIVVLKDGDVSLYNSKGGFRLGGKVSEEIRKAAKQALVTATAQIPKMNKAGDFSVPLPGHSKVYVLTPVGTLADQADSTHMDEKRPIYTLMAAIDPVITGFRHLEPAYKDAP